MLCAMYFAQGVPWGFMVTALIAYLAAQGVGDADLGSLTAWVLVPWTFKLVWGPLIDTVTIRSMGRRRPWIIGAELMMAVSLLGILMLGDLTNNLRLLALMFFIHNCFASLQDVSTDALAVDILPPDEQGKTNGFMWGSKLVGKAIGASVMAMIISAWGLQAAVMAQFIILLAIMLFPILMLERPGDKRFPWSKTTTMAGIISHGPATDVTQEPLAAHRLREMEVTHEVSSTEDPNPYRPPRDMDSPTEKEPGLGGEDVTSSLRNPIDVFKDLFRGFSLITTSVFIFFGLIHTIGWGIVEIITKPLYIQQLGWTYVQMSNVSGAAVFTEMIGALLGGFLADRFGRRKVMLIGFGSYGLLHAIFAALPGLWGESWFAAAYLFLSPGALAMGAVGFLSMGMRICWTRSAATMFTIYMTVSNVAHVIGNASVGFFRAEGNEWLSYEQTFWVAAISMWIPLLLLPLVNPDRVDEAKALER
jgi:PAT family beta-lactamase induction signal transducer AmpG